MIMCLWCLVVKNYFKETDNWIIHLCEPNVDVIGWGLSLSNSILNLRNQGMLTIIIIAIFHCLFSTSCLTFLYQNLSKTNTINIFVTHAMTVDILSICRRFGCAFLEISDQKWLQMKRPKVVIVLLLQKNSAKKGLHLWYTLGSQCWQFSMILLWLWGYLRSK